MRRGAHAPDRSSQRSTRNRPCMPLSITACGAVRLAHRSGRPGAACSNHATPTKCRKLRIDLRIHWHGVVDVYPLVDPLTQFHRGMAQPGPRRRVRDVEIASSNLATPTIFSLEDSHSGYCSGLLSRRSERGAWVRVPYLPPFFQHWKIARMVNGPVLKTERVRERRACSSHASSASCIRLAQLVEHSPYKRDVGGSSPSPDTNSQIRLVNSAVEYPPV